MSERSTTAVSEDMRWFAELTWTDHPNNLGWFIHECRSDGIYDHLTVAGTIDDKGQTAEDALQEWMEIGV